MRFHELLAHDVVTRPASGRIDFPDLLERANARLDAFDGTVDGIIWYWDFPALRWGRCFVRSAG